MKIVGALAAAFLIAVGQGAESSPDWRELWFRDKSERWENKSMGELRTSAESGSALASYVLAKKLWASGDKSKEGDRWMDAAAKAGLPQAIYQRAIEIYNSNRAESFRQLERAAATGFPEAKIRMSEALLEGREVSVDFGRAVELLQQAADIGSIDASVRLAQLYACGVGEPRSDADRPLNLYRKAAEAGHRDARDALVDRYRFGLGVEKDLLEAAAWKAKSLQATYRSSKGAWKNGLWRIDGAEDEFLTKLVALYEEALFYNSAKAARELGELHVRNEFGAVNLPRAAALFAFAGRGGGGNQAADLEKKFDAAQRAAFEKESRWLNGR